MEPYAKPPYTTAQHIHLLKERNLTINHPERATRYLNYIGYFRLAGYMYHLQSNDGSHEFNTGTTFDDVIQHYRFDKKLRRIISEYMERIEVALRAQLTNTYSNEFGFFWYTDRALYKDMGIYQRVNDYIAEEFSDPKEQFLKSFKKQYTDTMPSSNMALEILTFGRLCRLYTALEGIPQKQEIAEKFKLPATYLDSWLLHLCQARNICAHHSRLWNKQISFERPPIPSRKKYKFHGTVTEDFNRSMYGVVTMMERFLKNINPHNKLIEKITALFEEYPLIDQEKMGFPADWKTNPAWKDKEVEGTVNSTLSE